MKLQSKLDKIGITGSILAALCCLGVTAVVSVLSSIGLGFLINDRVLLPLLLGFLALAVAGLGIDARHHHHPSALIVAVASGIALFLFTWVAPSRPAAYAGIAGLIAASLWNLRLRRTPA